MIITIGNENLNTDTNTVMVGTKTHAPKIIIGNVVNIPEGIKKYGIELKNNDTPPIRKEQETQENFEGFLHESNLITLFTDIVVELDDTKYETQISKIWDGTEDFFSWYPPIGEENNPKSDFHLEVFIYIPLISQLYSMFQDSVVNSLGPENGDYMTTKLSFVQQVSLSNDLYTSFPPIQDLFSVENYVTLIFSRYPVFFQHKTQEQSSLNFCKAGIYLENKEQNLIYEVKPTEKNSCDFYQNFIHLANESKKDDDYSFRYFYILLQKKTA